MKLGNKRGVVASSAILFSVLLSGVGLAQSPARESTQHVPTSAARSRSAVGGVAKLASAVRDPKEIASASQVSSLAKQPIGKASVSLTPSIDAWIAVSGALISAIIGAMLQSVFGPLVQHQLEQRRKRNEQEEAAKLAAERDKAALAEQEQTFKDGVQAYRHKLLAEIQNLKILDMPTSLQLEDIYVQLRVREEEPLRYAKEEEMAPLASGEPTELLRRSQINLAERAEISLSPEDALASFPRMVVLGDPGAGKTTMLRYLALQMDLDAAAQLSYLPVYVELGRFVESGMDDLLNFAAADWDRRYGFPNALPYIEQQLHEGKSALLLDGLDEVLVGATPDEAQKAYKLVADEINRLDTRFSKAPIAVTCRKAGWRGGLKGFQTLEVLDFSWEQIQQLVNNWFKSNPAKAKGLRQALALNLRMQTLAANPLILSLIAIVYEEQLELPERRAELYNRCVEVLLREWDSHRGIKRFSQFTADRKRDLLKEVAWHFHIDGRRYFAEAELLHLVAGFLPTIDIPPSESKAILEEIAAQYGLLKVQAHGWYGFLHLTFQEYLAALAANEKGATGLQEVVAHRSDSWWEEVILLLAGRMHDATPLLLGLLGHSIDQPLPLGLAAKDDLFHSDLLLAARCLEGTPIIRMRGLRDRLLAEVKNLLQTSLYKLDWERTARVLVEIGGRATKDELVAMLADNNIERWKRWRIGSAFEELGDQSIAVRLLELLETEAELDPLVRECIVSALAELKATFAVPKLLDILKSDQDYGIQEKIAEVLGSLSDKSVVPELMDMLNDQKRDECVRSSIALSLGRLGDKSVAPVLLQMLLDKTTAPRMKLAIAQALTDLGDKSLASNLLKQLQDETIDWQIRWLLTEILESLEKSAIAPLREMLKSPNINQAVRVGIAATLGTWKVRDDIPDILRQAIESQVVPPNWCLGNYAEIGYVWQRITRTLKSLGDDSVVPVLVKAFEQRGSEQNRYVSSSNWFDEVKGVIVAASEYKPEAIARQVLAMLREQEWQPFQDDFLDSLSQLTTKSLVPELLGILAERKMYNVSHKRWMGIIQAIAQVADDRKTVKALLQMMPAKPSSDEEKHLAQVIYAALYSVSRRAGVRVSRDGKIESLVADSQTVNVILNSAPTLLLSSTVAPKSVK